ncbi:hypothetical protein CDD82_7086 [Ophiocordyceps australis]|uniref:Beta-lactamase-related domain-containing protein n=1 Tax=Ophiocordyceps australis TaxID=1399860 RepID=A0A2C5YSH8_9HYPO|nr:hypothetical protein CDD82_7086 [Ophiocordyceps australis]
MSLAVIDGHKVYAKGYGFATLPSTPATPETLWYGASTTKAYIAAAMGHLVDSGEHAQLAKGWDTAIASILRDDFVLEDEWATNHVTLDDAVSHRSGMTRHDKSCMHMVNGSQASPRDVVRNLRNLPLRREPRVKFSYCNLMYVTLGHALERLTGKPVAKLLHDVIWRPLGMKATFLHLHDALQAPQHLASGYWWDDQTDTFKPVEHMHLSELVSAGGIISNVLDYAQWIKCLIHQQAPFSNRVHADIRRPRIIKDDVSLPGLEFSLYGLGWEHRSYMGHTVLTHNGILDAFGAQVYWLPDAKFGAVAFANTAWTSNAVQDIVIHGLIRDKLGIRQGDMIDTEKSWKDMLFSMKHAGDKVDQDLFPDRANPPIPSTFRVESLEGTYSNAGFGEFTLHRELGPERRPAEIVLVADRSNMTWRYQFRLHHVSGNFWVVHATIAGNPTLLHDYHRGEFRAGINGNVSELKIEWTGVLGGDHEGTSVFAKVA